MSTVLSASEIDQALEKLTMLARRFDDEKTQPA